MMLKRSRRSNTQFFRCIQWKYNCCEIIYEEQKWFAKQSRRGSMAHQPPNFVAAHYLAMEIDGVGVEGSKNLTTYGASDDACVGSSMSPEFRAHWL